MISPRVCVSPVVFKDGKILLGQRATEPNIGSWVLPGGGVNIGETIHAACKREVKEEVGIDIQIIPETLRNPRVEQFIIEDNGVIFHRVFIMPIALHLSGRLKETSEITMATWFRPERLPETMPMITRAINWARSWPLTKKEDI